MEHKSQLGFGGWWDLGEILPFLLSLAGIERENKLNLSPCDLKKKKKHFNIKIASCWYQVAGGFQGNRLEVLGSR